MIAAMISRVLKLLPGVAAAAEHLPIASGRHRDTSRD